MNKFIKTSLLAYSVLAAIFWFKPTLADECSESKKTEIQRINKVSQGISEGVFFVRVFDGLIAVPNRYALRVEKSDLSSFSSPPDSLFSMHLPGEACLGGDLTFGDYADWVISDAANQNSPGWPKVVDKFDYRGLHIEKRTLPIGETSKTATFFFIHNGSQYMSILDDNEGLWKAMIDSRQ